MGTTASKVNKAEDVVRCRARKRLMKQAVAARHRFGAAHAAYIQAMKNVGAAFRQFGETELRESATTGPKNTSTTQSPDRPLPPPPPPVFSPRIGFITPPAPRKQLQGEDDNLEEAKKHEQEHDNDEFYYTDEEKVDKTFYYTSPPPPVPSSTAPPPPSPPQTSAWDYYDPFRPAEPPVHLQDQSKKQLLKQEATGAGEDEEDGDGEDEDEVASNPEKEEEQLVENRSVGSSKRDHLAIIVMPSGGIGHKDLMDVVREVDELFLRAYECGKNVSKLLEARKVHYHSNFADSKGYESHSKRVLQAISLHRATSKLPPKIVASEDHLSSPDEPSKSGSHAATLDRLLAWEKKLYEEVKNTERILLEYKKFSASTKAQDELSESSKQLLKDLSTKMQVAVQGVDTAITAINKIKEDELHGQLVLLIEGLMNMWTELYDCHQRQYRIVAEMKAMDHWGAVEPTTNLHRMATTQLETAVQTWYLGFSNLVSSQREYLQSLTGWLRLSNIQLEMEKSIADVGESKRQVRTSSLSLSTVQLCQDWSMAMDRLPDKVASESIKSFVTVVRKLTELQNEEVKLRKKLDVLRKAFDKKTASYVHKTKGWRKVKVEETGGGEAAKEETVENPSSSAEVTLPAIFLTREAKGSNKVESGIMAAKVKAEEVKEEVEKAVFNTRAMTINSLHTGLPSIFQAVTGFGRISLHAYQSLYCQAHNSALLRITQA